MWGSRERNGLIAFAAIGMTAGVVSAGSEQDTQTQAYSFPLSPGDQVLMFNQFDDQGGTRELLSVRYEFSGAMGAEVTAENESIIPAPDFALVLAGFLTLDFVEFSEFITINETFLTGGVEASDGVPGSGPDFFDFGRAESEFMASGMASDLTPFIGGGTVDAEIFASGGFSITGSTDSTIVIDNFGTLGEMTVIYEYIAGTGACCLPDFTCALLTEAECAAAGGGPFNPGLSCPEADCQQPDIERVACAEKGSLLFWSKVEIRWTAEGELLQDTFLSLTNDYPQDVHFQMYFINGDPPLDAVDGEREHPGWNWLDNEILLTGNQPTYWSALTGQPAAGGLSPFTALDPGFPPGRPVLDGTDERVLRGYILGWAVDRDGVEIRWNHLKGEGTLVKYGGGSSWEYGACAYRAVGAAHGQPTGSPGVLNLDGVEYAYSFDELLMNFQAVGSAAFSGPRLITSDTDLTLYPVDVDLRQETQGPVTTKANFFIWNENEVKFSGLHRCITCWDQTLLSMYDPPNHFLLQNLQTDHGKARITGIASQLCDFDFDQGDGALGTHPKDIVSQDTALLGVVARCLTIDAGQARAEAGTNLIGMGIQPSTVRYDVLGGPPEAASGSETTDAAEVMPSAN